MAKDIMAKDHMATAATTARRRLQRLLVHPVGRRPSSNSRRMGSPAAPTGASAGKPGRPRRHQHNKIEIAKKGEARFGSLSHLLPDPARGPASRRPPNLVRKRPGIFARCKNLPGRLRAERSSVPPRLRSVASQKYRTQTFAFHRAHLRTSRRTWRLVVLATQTPLILTLPAPHASRTCVIMPFG